MKKKFTPEDIERGWSHLWETKGYFAASGKGNPFCIPIPPPNITGTLHMGHGFQQAIIDALIRYHRMKGRNTLWQVGTDHAGIATQMVVERQIEAEGQSKEELGRDRFLEKVWAWKAESGGAITKQLRRLGTSPDWSRERFTMDRGLSHAVQQVFIKLYDEGIIYRGQRLVNWDPKYNTAISDLEVVQEEESGSLWYFRYPLTTGKHITIATTRPETMLGDAAVAVNPADTRFKDLIGQYVCLPFTNRKIPILADEYVDPDFGTGCLKITPAHDFNDYELGQRHQLPLINIFTSDARLNTKVPEKFQGLDRFEARKIIADEMEKLGLLEKIEPHKLTVPRGDRSGAIIEPWLTKQWYVDAKKLAGPAIDAVETGAVQFVPKKWENTYFAWMREIQDWCISRQLWWGHRIPAWYDKNGGVYVGVDERSIRDKHDLDDAIELHQDNDVLDTWFSSSLWTFSTLGWPKQTEELATFHPANVLVTGFDIIFFWVARMIMMSLHLMNEVPFHTVYVHGLVRDSEGQKMSKSKGNVLDPIDLIDGISLHDLISKRTSNLMQPHLAEKIASNTKEQFPDGVPGYGTDALRYTFYSLASPGRDIKFDLGRMEGYRNFCNKIWNAARYVHKNIDSGDSLDGIEELSPADRWIKSRFQRCLETVDRAYSNFRFDLASQTIYDFIWSEFCDWYLEFSKPVFRGENFDSKLKLGTRRTLLQVLEQSMRMLHPFMPFLTEEIWQSLRPLSKDQGSTIMLAEWPNHEPANIDINSEREIEFLQQFITAVRAIRAESGIDQSKKLAIIVRGIPAQEHDSLVRNERYLAILAKIESITTMNSDEDPPPSFMVLCSTFEVRVAMGGIVDLSVELARLDKELLKLKTELERLEVKLQNTAFLEKAPKDIVAAERAKEEQLKLSLETIQLQRKKINRLRSS